MSNEAKAFFEKWSGDMKKMQEQAPDMMTGFGAFFQKVMKDGAISLILNHIYSE